MTAPLATRAWHAVLPLLAAACAGAPAYSPGKLDDEGIAKSRAVAQAWYDRSPDYPRLLDELRGDPAALGWFVRYLEAAVVSARQGTSETTGERTLRAQPGAQHDLGPEIADLTTRARSRSDAEQLRVGDEAPGERAADAIVAIGAPAVPVLVADLLQSQQQFLRAIGVELLARIGPPAVPALLVSARDGGSTERRAAAHALGDIGATGEALVALRELAASSDWGIRAEAAQALHHGGADARALLITMLRDGDPFVRKKAAETLGAYADPVAAGALIDFLERNQQQKDLDGELAAQKGLQTMAHTRNQPRSVAAWRSFAAGLAERERR